MRTFAFGDIHGCHEPLLALLNAIDPQPDDTLIFLGDMIDRGADSKGVIDTLRALEKRCHVIAIMGNHEEMMIASQKYFDERRYWLKYGGFETLKSFGGVGNDNDILCIPAEYFSWLKNLNPYYETEKFIFCHATPLPHLDMAKQSSDGLRWRFIPTDMESRTRFWQNHYLRTFCPKKWQGTSARWHHLYRHLWLWRGQFDRLGN